VNSRVRKVGQWGSPPDHRRPCRKQSEISAVA